MHDGYPKLRFPPVQADLFSSYEPTDGNPGFRPVFETGAFLVNGDHHAGCKRLEERSCAEGG
jgi:hypothetical protein